jgi:hypothetical protein
MLQKQIDRIPELANVRLQEMQVVIPGSPAPAGTIVVRISARCAISLAYTYSLRKLVLAGFDWILMQR